MLRTTTIGLAGLALFAVSGTSQADRIDMTVDSSGAYGQGVHYRYDPDGTGGNVPLIDGNTTAGLFSWTVKTEGSVSFAGHTFNHGDTLSTFSTKLTEYITPGAMYSFNSTAVADMPSRDEIGPRMGAFRAGLIQELFDNHYRQAVTGTTLQAAAFQVALWEIVYEDRLAEVGSGGGPTVAEVFAAGADTFAVSENFAVVQLADMWLDALTGGYLANGTLIGFGSDSESIGASDQLGMPAMVPLPAPIWLAGMGLLGIVFGRKRLRRLAMG